MNNKNPKVMSLTKATPEEADDLLITPYIQNGQLPEMLQRMLRPARTWEEKDILLLSSLTAVSACLPNRYFRHGDAHKRYFSNLQTFIMAGAASGKGIASEALRMLQPIDEETPVLLPGDSTYPAFFKRLYEQGGVGYMHESEGSVITDIWKSGAMNYNTALRKAAEHEPISRSRITHGLQVIKEPRVSMLLTGTYDQFKTLVPSVQNGFFSRLTMLVIRKQQAFRKDVFCGVDHSKQPIDAIAPIATIAPIAAIPSPALELKKLYETLYCSEMQEFRLTAEQAEEAGRYFEQEYGALLKQLGPNFHPSVIRMGVTLVRLAMILSLLRNAEATICEDVDFQTAKMLCGKLLLHAADAYQQIEGYEVAAVPEPRASVQKISFFATLPQEFQAGECMAQGAKLGVSERTVRRWIDDWFNKGITRKISYGIYRKVA